MARVIIKTIITGKNRSTVTYDITDDKGNVLESDKQFAYSINLSNANVKIDIAQQSAKHIKLAMDNITSKPVVDTGELKTMIETELAKLTSIKAVI